MEGFKADPTLSAVLPVAWPGPPGANRGSHIQGFGEIGRTSNEHSKRDIIRNIRLCLSCFLFDWEEMLGAGC